MVPRFVELFTVGSNVVYCIRRETSRTLCGYTKKYYMHNTDSLSSSGAEQQQIITLNLGIVGLWISTNLNESTNQMQQLIIGLLFVA